MSAQALQQTPFTAATLPTGDLLSESGPTFRVSESELPARPGFIAYGDQRFTDPANVTATDPRVRKWLVQRIAEEKPAAIVLNGDVPLAGDVKNDYAVFQTETKPWRDARLHVFPALGNHEFHFIVAQCDRRTGALQRNYNRRSAFAGRVGGHSLRGESRRNSANHDLRPVAGRYAARDFVDRDQTLAHAFDYVVRAGIE